MWYFKVDTVEKTDETHINEHFTDAFSISILLCARYVTKSCLLILFIDNMALYFLLLQTSWISP